MSELSIWKIDEGMEGDLTGGIASHQLIAIFSNRMLCGLSA